VFITSRKLSWIPLAAYAAISGRAAARATTETADASSAIIVVLEIIDIVMIVGWIAMRARSKQTVERWNPANALDTSEIPAPMHEMKFSARIASGRANYAARIAARNACLPARRAILA
jgi:hypothetical protein